MRSRSLFSLAALLLAAALLPSPLVGEGLGVRGLAASADKDALPAGLEDAPFSRYVELSVVRKTLVDRDPALLCDVALQLAEGERVLLRPHKGLTASRMLRLALDVAVEKNDKKTLDRLARAARRDDNKDLAEKVKAAQGLGGDSRRFNTGTSVRADSMSVEALLLYRSFLEQIKLAAALNDKVKLARLEKGIPNLPELKDTQRALLRKMIAEAKKQITDTKEDDGDDLLRKLAASSRSHKQMNETLAGPGKGKR
jgi:hypothetical protein